MEGNVKRGKKLEKSKEGEKRGQFPLFIFRLFQNGQNEPARRLQ